MPGDTEIDNGLKYKRVLLKISGEALMGPTDYGIHMPTCLGFAQEIAAAQDLGVEICLVIGGGNIFRGIQLAEGGMDRAQGDYMGMLATVINAMALQDAMENLGVKTRVMSWKRFASRSFDAGQFGIWRRAASSFLRPVLGIHTSPQILALRSEPLKCIATR